MHTALATCTYGHQCCSNTQDRTARLVNRARQHGQDPCDATAPCHNCRLGESIAWGQSSITGLTRGTPWARAPGSGIAAVCRAHDGVWNAGLPPTPVKARHFCLTAHYSSSAAFLGFASLSPSPSPSPSPSSPTSLAATFADDSLGAPPECASCSLTHDVLDSNRIS